MKNFIQSNKLVYSLTVAIFVATVFGVFIISNDVFAQSTPNYGLDTVAQKSGLSGSGAINDTDAFVGSIIRSLIGFVGTIFLLLVIYAGITWMTAAGNEERIAKAKKILVSSAIGLALVVLSYAIANFIASAVLNSAGESSTNTNPTGSCIYISNGSTVCSDGFSQNLCETSSGSFSTLSCADR